MPPLLIIALVVIALIVVAYLAGLRPQPARGRRPPPTMLRRRSRWRRLLPIVPLVAAVGCLVLAFTGFRLNVQETSPAIVLVMDVSRSMERTDVAPNRLEAAKAAAVAFLDELPAGFRVGLATFAGMAQVPVAPTQDRDEVVRALGELTTSPKTVIGDGLAAALDAIEEIRRDAEATPAAALLLSDGRDTGSEVSPAAAADRADSLDVPVFTVVIGEVGAGEGPRVDLETLEVIADRSGGQTFTATSAGELTAIYENLGSELSVELDVESSTTPLVVAAIVLTVVAGLMLVYAPR
ncbi:MAG: VWA domain-containing protein [Actinomycetota bacterium]